MGASDFLSGSAPRSGVRVLADATLVRRPSEPDTAGRRPPVLQRHHGPTQLALFSQYEPRSHWIDATERDAALGDEPAIGERPGDLAPAVD